MKKNALRKVILTLGTVVAPVALVVSCSGETKSLETLTAEDFLEALKNYAENTPLDYTVASEEELYAEILNGINGIDGVEASNVSVSYNGDVVIITVTTEESKVDISLDYEDFLEATIDILSNIS